MIPFGVYSPREWQFQTFRTITTEEGLDAMKVEAGEILNKLILYPAKIPVERLGEVTDAIHQCAVIHCVCISCHGQENVLITLLQTLLRVGKRVKAFEVFSNEAFERLSSVSRRLVVEALLAFLFEATCL